MEKMKALTNKYTLKKDRKYKILNKNIAITQINNI